jgi:hypothetical protein
VTKTAETQQPIAIPSHCHKFATKDKNSGTTAPALYDHRANDLRIHAAQPARHESHECLDKDRRRAFTSRRRIFGSNFVFADVGANYGTFAICLARELGPQGMVYACI